VETIGRRSCRRSDGGALATPVGYQRLQYGYISNIVSAEQGVGTASCPWLVQVRSGQRINFTVVNFLGQSVNPLDQVLYLSISRKGLPTMSTYFTLYYSNVVSVQLATGQLATNKVD